MFAIDNKMRIVVTGGSGFLGTHVVAQLKKEGFTNISVPRSKEFDLRNPVQCKKVVKNADVIVHLAANVGGIGYNKNFPATLFYDNILIGTHMLHEAHLAGVSKFVAVGTVCAYPKYTPVPFEEKYLWNGYPEETNAPYGLAKKMLLVASHAYRKQHQFNSIYLLPVNMYGPKDNFDPKQSHVVPALIRKIYQAKIEKKPSVTVWGTGSATREFLYVADAADAIISAMKKYNSSEPINIGSGSEISITNLVLLIAQNLKYTGQIIWDKTKPDGQPRRLLNTQRAYEQFGFRAKTDLEAGIKKTIQWYVKNYGK